MYWIKSLTCACSSICSWHVLVIWFFEWTPSAERAQINTKIADVSNDTGRALKHYRNTRNCFIARSAAKDEMNETARITRFHSVSENRQCVWSDFQIFSTRSGWVPELVPYNVFSATSSNGRKKFHYSLIMVPAELQSRGFFSKLR